VLRLLKAPIFEEIEKAYKELEQVRRSISRLLGEKKQSEGVQRQKAYKTLINEENAGIKAIIFISW